MMQHFTGILAMVSEELGSEVAEKLVEARGGREVYIPLKPLETHELSKIIGLKNAQALSKLCGAGNVLIPLSYRRTQKILDLKAQGLSHADIAAKLYITTKTVSRALSAKPDPNQLRFDFEKQ